MPRALKLIKKEKEQGLQSGELRQENKDRVLHLSPRVLLHNLKIASVKLVIYESSE